MKSITINAAPPTGVREGLALRADGPHRRVAKPVARGWHSRIKPAIDAVLAALLCIPAAPFLLCAAALIKLTSRGPVLFRQNRLGLRGRVFVIYKLRTMTHECERHSGPRWSAPGDPRITPVGRVLRRLHIDELPQLWNVLRGDMSLVGPRPERPEFLPALEEALPHYRRRLEVRPGITGLAQVQLPADTDIASVRRKLAYDVYYVDRHTFGLDLRLILATGGKLLGIPFAWTGAVLRIPRGARVEHHQQPADKPARGPHLQFS